MARTEHVFYCGEAATTGPLPRGARSLVEGDGPECNLTIRISGLERQLIAEIPAVYRDLLLIAVYTLTADQAVERGDLEDSTDGAAWRRAFRLRIPVACPDVWARPGLRDGLERTLNFLSDDYFTFEFVPATADHSTSKQTMFKAEDGGSFLLWSDVGEVAMFSGGLDSFTGAHHQVVKRGGRPLLVSHRSSSKMWEVQTRLIEHLRKLAPSAPPIHVAVEYTKLDTKLKRERTQRTRSFLYAALGATAAKLVRRQSVTFYENGIVTFNLPVSKQLVGAKATRTTHPKVLRGFADLFSAIEGNPVAVTNPFVFDTRAEVMKRLVADGGGRFIAETVSCAHVHEATKMAPHCGVCSQCVDRRFAAEAAGCLHLDPVDRYAVDIINPSRKDKYKDKPISTSEKAQRLYLMEYVRTARRFAAFSNYDELLAGFGQANRAISGGVEALSVDAREVAERIFQLHKRFGDATESVLRAWLGRYALDIADGKMDGSFLTSLMQREGTGVNGTQQAVAEVPTLSAVAAAPTFPAGRPVCQRASRDIWWVGFPGDKTLPIQHQVGLDYIALLVRHPGQDFTARELVTTVNPPEVADPGAAAAAREDGIEGAEMDVIDELLDERGLKAARAELAAYAAAITAADANYDPVGAAKLRAKAQSLQRIIDLSTDADGRPRKVADASEKARKAVSNAIDRTLASIRKNRPDGMLLATHLSRSINKGAKFSYNQMNMNWIT